ncbi:MAG: D-alanyl-D-alanine carboxypeptidase/D-alanyl-D-alanine-endopeptidase [Spirochaetaceae bacterium]|nr:D-alanyl-D-alanine carboxypeptidase/D-alanyl-D-alanine-endopeptidase [Spirochaetaceae bacterium]
MRGGALAAASVGMHVARARDGVVVYSRGGERPMIPASNQKILTALAALHRFGPAHRFSTRVWAPAPPDADGFVSELLLEGGGDPAMNSEDWWRLAADLRREGLRGVKGDLRIDDTLFEEPGWHPSWGRVSARAYHAPIGALTANYGSYFVSVWPQRPGSAPRVDIDPPVDYLRLRNTAVTQPRSERPRLVVDRLPGRASDGPVEEVVRVEGATRAGDRVDRFPRSVLDPGLYAGSLLALQLEANGIFVDGEVRRGPRGAEEPLSLLLDRGGRSVAEAVALCMKYSNNSIAESLVKNLAIGPAEGPAGSTPRRGDWAGGIRALREALGELGVDLSGATLVDGSGLSIQNRLSPRMLVEALRAGRASFRIGPEFVASLPIAELDGTLDKRLRGAGGRIRAKTGLLSDAGVTALSGFVDRPDGETLVFSIVVNGFREGASGAMQAVDRLALLLIDADLGVAQPGGAELEHPVPGGSGSDPATGAEETAANAPPAS